MTGHGSNSYANAQRWVSEIEKHQETKLSIMMTAVANCAPIEKMIREAKAAAKAAGIPSKVLAAALKERDLLRKVVKNRESLEDETAEELEEMISALEPVRGLPLFDNAIDAAETKKAKTEKKAAKVKQQAADIDALAGDADPQTASNVVALEKGIKTLN